MAAVAVAAAALISKTDLRLVPPVTYAIALYTWSEGKYCLLSSLHKLDAGRLNALSFDLSLHILVYLQAPKQR